MRKEHQEIMDLVSKYLEEFPNQRFGQAIFNLGINEFKNKTQPEKENYSMRDIHNDQDSEIIDRIKLQLELFEKQKKK